MATQKEKEQKNLQKARLQSQKKRGKSEKKAAKTAAKTVAKQLGGSRVKAAQHFQKVGNNFMGLPPVLWPLMLVVGYIWVRNTWDKESRERDLREAREFLRESRGFRI